VRALTRSIAALFLLLVPAASLADTVVVTADRMLDVKTGRYVEEPVIVITDGRIASIVARNGGRPNIPAGARRIDLPGMTLLPGLIDMHVHLTSSPFIRGYRRLEVTDAFWPTLGVPNAQKMLEAGFTTIRSMGAGNYADVGIRQGIDRGFYPGPRIVAAGPSFGPTGGHCDTNDLPPSITFRDGERGVNGPDEVRARVRELRRRGAQVIKVCATGGVFSINTEPGAQQMTEAELSAAVAEAHMLGLKVAAHAHGTDGIKTAIRAGVDTIEHASFLDDEAIRLARERGTWLSMDVYNTDYTLTEGEKNGVPQENLDKERQVGTRQRESFRQSVRAGVRHVFGTDAGVYPHGTGARQFHVMVNHGMTPIQAIRTATSNAAEALGRSADVGTIEVGRFGDLVAVTRDPLTDVRALEDVMVVIKGGVLATDRRQSAAAQGSGQ
jgi:imidazolonepropionase-like amidohydrolase